MIPTTRPAPRDADSELRVLAHWEAFVPWLLDHCARWPRSARFSLTQRLENHALDVLELLVVARYEPKQRTASLREANLRLERMRFVCRVARSRGFMTTRAFEKSMRDIDETGRMLHGWRQRSHPGGRASRGTNSRSDPNSRSRGSPRSQAVSATESSS